MFQSLLSWKYNQIYIDFSTTLKAVLFQSLLSWKYNQILSQAVAVSLTMKVSILVILEIQSDLEDIEEIVQSAPVMFQSLLSWKYNQIYIDFSTTLKAVLFQSLLSWKYNQIACCWVTVNYTG